MRSAAIIHDLTTFALPPQVPSDDLPELFWDGCCRVCANREPGTMSAAFYARYSGERECEIFDCLITLTLRTEAAECACCGEIVIAGTACSSYLTAWTTAVEARYVGARA
jgi:hypothetical protein